MRDRRSAFRGARTLAHLARTLALGLLVLLAACAGRPPANDPFPGNVHQAGRAAFRDTLRARLVSHPDRDQLTEAELARVERADAEYPLLYDILMNIYYQKDEPTLKALLSDASEESQRRFRDTYLDLSRGAAESFVDNFFLTPGHTEYMRRTNPAYAQLDALDLAVRSVGYFAKLDSPGQRKDLPYASPEFDRQWGLDAANFRRAHEVTRGRGVKVGILDTGIDEKHPVFGDTEWGEHFSLVGRTGEPWNAEAPIVDWGWHGTLISSVVARYAPEARISMYKFGDGDTQNDPAYQLLAQSLLAAAIYRAVHDGNDVISISAAGASLDADYLADAVRYAHDQNRVVLAGSLYHHWLRAGNNLNYPGQYETVISVTAIEKRSDGTLGYWDTCAPDDTTTVAAPNGVFGAFPTYVLDQEDTYIPSISAAIPVVSSLVALAIAEYPRLGTEGPGEYADTIIRLITDNANPQIVGFEGFSPECGYGLIDAQATVAAASRLRARRDSVEGETQ